MSRRKHDETKINDAETSHSSHPAPLVCVCRGGGALFLGVLRKNVYGSEAYTGSRLSHILAEYHTESAPPASSSATTESYKL